MCVQYHRILMSSFGEQDFQRFPIQLLVMFKLALAINLLLMYVAPPFEQTLITHIKDYLCAISKNVVQ